jgi:hypothetical protein
MMSPYAPFVMLGAMALSVVLSVTGLVYVLIRTLLS